MGAGYVGLVLGAGLADFGLTVTCVDIDQEKIRMLEQGRIPIYEPGLDELVSHSAARGRLIFSAEMEKAVRESEVIFLAVGTNLGADGLADLSQIWAAADLIARCLDRNYKVVVTRSTVPVGTNAQLHQRLRERAADGASFDVVSNPEFLREGSAVEDFFHPKRVVIGSSSERATAVMKEIYRSLYLVETPFVFTTWECAEITKYAANAFLALKISFVNELANLCEAVGPCADVHTVVRALGLDPRIGSKFLHPGPGFGGYCFPKDPRALAQTARALGTGFETVEAAIAVNDRQYLRTVEKLRLALESLDGKVVALLGLSFKPNTDDVRESRAIKIAEALLKEGCGLRVFDPVAMPTARRVLTDARVTFCSDGYEAARSSQALVVATEWNEFRNLDLKALKQQMLGDVLIDTRNVFDVARAKERGFRYYGTGRC